jgi:hypothetical protein
MQFSLTLSLSRMQNGVLATESVAVTLGAGGHVINGTGSAGNAGSFRTQIFYGRMTVGRYGNGTVTVTGGRGGNVNAGADARVCVCVCVCVCVRESSRRVREWLQLALLGQQEEAERALGQTLWL